METNHSPVVIIEVGAFETCLGLFVNGAFICGSSDFMDNESIEMKANVIAKIIGCEVEKSWIETSQYGYIKEMWEWEEVHSIAIENGLIPGMPDEISHRARHFLYINHYF